MTEYLIELLMDQAKEGGGEGGLLAGLRLQLRTEAGCFLYQEEHLVCRGLFSLVSTKHGAKHSPCLQLVCGFFPTRYGGNLLLPISRLVYTKEFKVPPPNIAPNFLVSRADSEPTKGESLGKTKFLSASPTPSGSLVWKANAMTITITA